MTVKHAAASWIRKQPLEISRQKPSHLDHEELAQVLPREWKIRGVKVEKAGYIIPVDPSFVNCGIHNVQMIPFG